MSATIQKIADEAARISVMGRGYHSDWYQQQGEKKRAEADAEKTKKRQIEETLKNKGVLPGTGMQTPSNYESKFPAKNEVHKLLRELVIADAVKQRQEKNKRVPIYQEGPENGGDPNQTRRETEEERQKRINGQ